MDSIKINADSVVDIKPLKGVKWLLTIDDDKFANSDKLEYITKQARNLLILQELVSYEINQDALIINRDSVIRVHHRYAVAVDHVLFYPKNRSSVEICQCLLELKAILMT